MARWNLLVSSDSLLETAGVSSCLSWATTPSVMANESMASVQTKESSTITPHQERNPPKGDQLDTRRGPANCYSVLYRDRIQPGRTDGDL